MKMLSHLKNNGKAGWRNKEDILLLQHHANFLDADILFLQEIASMKALIPIFGERYHLYLSSSGRNMKQALAIKKTKIDQIKVIALQGLNINNFLRDGIQLRLVMAGLEIDFLAVHLKSTCHDLPLFSKNKHCTTLKAQIPPIKAWMANRVKEKRPFILVGDFNRRFDKEPMLTFHEDASFEAQGWMWPNLFLKEANGYFAGLVRPNRFLKSNCYQDKYDYFIDHFILNEPAASLVVLDSFKEYFLSLPESVRHKLSDHCPIGISLKIAI